MHRLPVDEVLGDVLGALAASTTVVLSAPPGSGKTTRVPPALLDAECVEGRVLLLQPRRAAARMVARRIAHERGCKVGEEVGYSVRFERRVSRATRLEVVTEGLLSRRIQNDPFLEGVGAVVLDEVHERSLHTDLALALVREVQRDARPELKLVVMSATLDSAPLLSFFGPDVPLICAEGRAHPVDISYEDRPDSRSLESRVAAAVVKMFNASDAGHILAFLPGRREIDATLGALRGSVSGRVLPLHGGLSASEQDRALAPSAERKVVVSTNIAETSVTIDGVIGVVDSGLVRRPVYDARLDQTRLVTVPTSRASADQRAGRAGRTGPGVCHRLWTRNDHGLRQEHSSPEIARVDLCGLLLNVLSWGSDPSHFGWFERPPDGALLRAMSVLEAIGAVEGGRLTPTGRQLARLPLHPRLARVVVEGERLGCALAAAGVAALASESDPWRQSSRLLGAAGEDDLLGRLARLDVHGTGAEPRALRRVRDVRDQLVGIVGRSEVADLSESGITEAIRTGFPDRVALRRGETGRAYRLASGSGARLPEWHQGAAPEAMIVVSMRAGRRGSSALVSMAAPMQKADLPTEVHRATCWDAERRSVVQREEDRYGELVLREWTTAAPDTPQTAALLAEHALQQFDKCLSWTPAARSIVDRTSFVRRVRPEVEMAELANPESWLLDLCLGHRSFDDLLGMDLASFLMNRLSWSQRRDLDVLAPERLRVPSGAEVMVSYAVPEQPPVVRVRIQQMFGATQTPHIAGEPVLLHLLAPNHRPAQVTRDLAGFWRGSYAEVRKALRGRYPKHAWPEAPETATPENRPKRGRS